jgi:proteasome accessory factor B
VRQWALIRVLDAHPKGLTTRQIMQRTGVKHATFYRDRDQLLDAGIPIETQTVTGEVRHTLWGTKLPPLGPTPLQVAALRLARRALGLDGTAAAAELDKLLADYARAAGSNEAITIAKRPAIAPELLNKLDRAISAQRRTRIRYRSVNASAFGWRAVDPLGLHYVKGHLYFIGHDDQRDKVVPFKLDRISAVVVLADQAARHRDVDLHASFARSAKIWSGDEIEIAVRVHAAAARFAPEYPLVGDQIITDEPNGAVVVRARVAGIVEATRWVLSWGKNATALEPPALREAVAAEVRGAAEQYAERRSAVKKPSAAKSHRRKGGG